MAPQADGNRVHLVADAVACFAAPDTRHGDRFQDNLAPALLGIIVISLLPGACMELKNWPAASKTRAAHVKRHECEKT